MGGPLYWGREVGVPPTLPLFPAPGFSDGVQAGRGSAKIANTVVPRCAGPKLHSFAGLSTKMSPKARINTILGYTAPFDRHDWVVDRCGTTVEYVIDFYAGRPDAHGRPSFYLDVRPKLNSWEGVKMRLLRGAGLV